jgi:hypothetical protein
LLTWHNCDLWGRNPDIGSKVVDKVQMGLSAGAVGHLGVGNVNLDSPAVPDMDPSRTSMGAHIADTIFHYFRLRQRGMFSLLIKKIRR